MKKVLLLAVAALLAMSCSTLKVTSDYDGAVDFKAYKTYKVLYFVNEEDANKNEFPINQLNQKRIENSLSNEANMRGYEASETPDVYFLYALDIDMKTSYSANTTYTGGNYMGYSGRHYGGYGYNGMGGSSYTTVDEYDYKIGLLRVAMVDTKTKELLWIGSASKEISGKTKDADERVAKVIAKIMGEFPVPLPESK